MTDFGSIAECLDGRRLARSAVVFALLVAAACSSEKTPTAAPAAKENQADQHVNDQADARNTAMEAAEARGVARVEADMKADDAREKDRTDANR
jgi:hypothetical protein